MNDYEMVLVKAIQMFSEGKQLILKIFRSTNIYEIKTCDDISNNRIILLAIQ